MTPDESHLEWTGERYVPGSGGVQIALEHQHRYRVAARLVRGRRVLDAGSGEGYGAHLLAENAERVTGIEIDPATVDHARRRYPEIDFQLGDVGALPFADASFEAVVSFETIEHVDGPEQAIAEFRRVLAPGGLLVLSTPNVPGAPDAATSVNPFHRTEFDEPALRALLGAFEVEAVIPQRILGLSVIGSPDPGELDLDCMDGDAGEPRFLLTLARVSTSTGEGTVEPPEPSGLLELGGLLVAEYARWLEDAQAVVREKEALIAEHKRGRNTSRAAFLDLEARARISSAEHERERNTSRAEFLDLEARARIWLAELELLRATNERLAGEYDELADAQAETLDALAKASAALRTSV